MLAWMGRRSPIGGCSVQRPVCASVFEGFVSEWEVLPGSKLSSARQGPRLQAGSRRLGFPPHPGFIHFWSVSRVPPRGLRERPGKDNGRVLQVLRLGWGPSG